MNRQERLALGVGLVLIFGVVGVASVMESVSITERPYESSGEASGQGEGKTAGVTIPVVQAMRTAENETNGTAVEARLGQEEDTNSTERPTRIYEISVLTANGSRTVVDVNANNSTVLRTRPAQNQTDGLESVFGGGNQNETPNRQLDIDAIRSGPEAVQLARDAAGTNRTVSRVELASRNGTAVYEISMVTTAGDRSTVVVAVYPDEGGVLSTGAETQSAAG